MLESANRLLPELIYYYFRLLNNFRALAIALLVIEEFANNRAADDYFGEAGIELI